MTDDDRCPNGDDETALTAPESVEPTADELTEIFDLLSCTRRRYVAYYLYGIDGSAVAVDEVADYVHGIEGEEQVSDRRERVRVDLHHAQLPKLDECGAVDYDRRTRTVRYVGWTAFDDWVEWVYGAEIGRDP